SAIQRLEPRPEAGPLERLDPLTRGRLIHRVQAATLRALADAGELPVRPATLPAAERQLAACLAEVAAELEDQLVPPIRRVWEDEITAIGADLVQWLRRLAEDAGRWEPLYFELGFGLPPGEGRDPASRREPVTVGD